MIAGVKAWISWKSTLIFIARDRVHFLDEEPSFFSGTRPAQTSQTVIHCLLSSFCFEGSRTGTTSREIKSVLCQGCTAIPGTNSYTDINETGTCFLGHHYECMCLSNSSKWCSKNLPKWSIRRRVALLLRSHSLLMLLLLTITGNKWNGSFHKLPKMSECAGVIFKWRVTEKYPLKCQTTFSLRSNSFWI